MAENQPNIQEQPTSYDIAGAAGVSIATISRVLNGHRNARLATWDRTSAATAA